MSTREQEAVWFARAISGQRIFDHPPAARPDIAGQATGRKPTDFGAITPAVRRIWDRAKEESKRPSIFLTHLLAGDRNRFWTATGRLSPKNGRMRPVCRYIGP